GRAWGQARVGTRWLHRLPGLQLQMLGHLSGFYLPRGPPPPPPNGLGWKGFCEVFLLLLPGISFCPITIVSPSLISRPAISVTRPLLIPPRTPLISGFLSGPRTYIICPWRRPPRPPDPAPHRPP